MTDLEEKTRVTNIIANPEVDYQGSDCLVIIYTSESGLLGKRFPLDHSPLRVGRGDDNDIVLQGDSVSRTHALFERIDNHWHILDDNSTNGTYLNEGQLSSSTPLKNADRIKVGSTILKFLSGADAEAKYHEEIYRMTIVDGLTQIHNKRYLHEALEREVIRARRHQRDLSIMMFDIDYFKRVNDDHGHLAGDYVLRELAQLVQERIRRDEVLARYGGEEFVTILPETPLTGAVALSEDILVRVAEYPFVFHGQSIPITISAGCAVLIEGADKSASDLIQRADENLYKAKRAGRNRVCS